MVVEHVVDRVCLHALQTGLILQIGILARVVGNILRERTVGIDHEGIRGLQILEGAVLLVEHMAKLRFTEVARVVPNDILNNLHALFVNRVDQILIISAFALITGIDGAEIKGVIAVVVIARSVGYNRRDPDGGKAERLDVIELVDQTLEVASPSGVGVGVVRFFVVPAVDVVALVAVIETGGDDKVDRILTEIGSVNIRTGSGCGFLVIPLVTLVPPFTGVAGKLGRLLAVYNKQHIDFCRVAESVLIIVITLRCHCLTRI